MFTHFSPLGTINSFLIVITLQQPQLLQLVRPTVFHLMQLFFNCFFMKQQPQQLLQLVRLTIFYLMQLFFNCFFMKQQPQQQLLQLVRLTVFLSDAIILQLLLHETATTTTTTTTATSKTGSFVYLMQSFINCFSL